MFGKIDLYDPHRREVIHVPEKLFARFIMEGALKHDSPREERAWQHPREGEVVAEEVLNEKSLNEAKLKHAVYLEEAGFEEVQDIIDGSAKPWRELEDLFKQKERNRFYIHKVNDDLQPEKEWMVYRLTEEGLYFEGTIGG